MEVGYKRVRFRDGEREFSLALRERPGERRIALLAAAAHGWRVPAAGHAANMALTGAQGTTFVTTHGTRTIAAPPVSGPVRPQERLPRMAGRRASNPCTPAIARGGETAV